MKKLKCTAAFTLMIIVSTIIFCPTIMAQKLPDSTLAKISRVELGNYYMKKSKKQKLLGYALYATGIATFVAAGTAGDPETGIPLFAVSMISLSFSNPTLSHGAKNKGKAEMLLRYQNPKESPEDIKALASSYKSNAKTSSFAGWTLLLGGIAGLFVSAATESGPVAVISLTSMFVSVPVWMNAAKNRGRVSILMNNESIPVSLNSNSSFRSIGVSIPITK